MPPKFVRHLTDDELLDANNSERTNLLRDSDGSGSDEDFFLKNSPISRASNNHRSNEQSVHYSHNSSPSALDRVHGEVNEVVTIMRDNVGKVLQRGDNLDALYDKSEHLSSNADQFRVSSRHLSRAMWWRDCKTKLLLASVVVVLLLIIIIPVIIQQSKGDDPDG